MKKSLAALQRNAAAWRSLSQKPGACPTGTASPLPIGNCC